MARTSDLRSEYLKFIRQYIDDNHCAPRLEEIARHFNVTEPTAHKMLSSLEKAGSLYFDRDDFSGFYIRLVEWVETTAPLSEILIAGGIDRYGQLHEFPKKHGHFTLVLPGYEQKKLFALQAWQHIPQADILANDVLIFYQAQEPQIGAMSIIPFGDDLITVHLVSQDDDGRFFWSPLAYDESTKDIYKRYFEKHGIKPTSVDRELILASAIALNRKLAL